MASVICGKDYVYCESKPAILVPPFQPIRGFLNLSEDFAMQSLDSFRKPDSKHTLGIEIEGAFPAFSAPPYKSYLGFFYITDDGSISLYPLKSRELVSQPLPANWLKKEIHRLEKKVGKWQVNDSCGIHIHVSREWLSKNRAKEIYKFIKGLDYQTMEEVFGRQPNDFCRTDANLGATRYCAINTENKNTIEFRMFASGDAEWACYCVDMAVYLIRNAKKLNVDALLAFMDMTKPRSA